MADDLEPIACDDRTRALLVQLRRELWRSSERAHLDGTVVDTARATLGPLPDELLAHCAAIGSMAMLLSENEELETFYRANEQADWRTRAQVGDAVAFDAWGDWPRSYAMVSPGDRTFGIYDLKTSTLEWRGALADVLARRLDPDVAPPTADELATFQPAIARTRATVRRVLHAKFGTGTVLRAAEGKLEIDFGGDHGIKVLAERFVRDA